MGLCRLSVSAPMPSLTHTQCAFLAPSSLTLRQLRDFEATVACHTPESLVGEVMRLTCLIINLLNLACSLTQRSQSHSQSPLRQGSSRLLSDQPLVSRRGAIDRGLAALAVTVSPVAREFGRKNGYWEKIGMSYTNLHNLCALLQVQCIHGFM